MTGVQTLLFRSEGGDAGGEVIAVGTPEQVAEVAASHTGRFLRPLLGLDAPKTRTKAKAA